MGPEPLQQFVNGWSHALEVTCLSRRVAAVGEPPKGIGSGHRVQGLANRLLQRFMRPGTYPSQKGGCRLEKVSSMGEESGEYAGKKNSSQPLARVS